MNRSLRLLNKRLFLYMLVILFGLSCVTFLLFKISKTESLTDEIVKKNLAVTNKELLELLFLVNIVLLLLVVLVGFYFLRKYIRSTAKADKVLKSYRESKNFLNALTDGILVQNNKGFILECNAAAEKILGLSADQITGKPSTEIKLKTITEDGSVITPEMYPSKHVFSTGKAIENVVLGIYVPNGNLRWIRINTHPVSSDPSGAVVSVVSSFTDITDYKLSKEKNNQNEERIRLALDTTGDNAWEHNFETGKTWFSATNNHFLGYSAEELNEAENVNAWWSNTHPEDKHLLVATDTEYKKGTRSNHSLEYRIFHKDGTIKWVLDRGVVIKRDINGMPLRIVGTHTDISNEKLAEQNQQLKEKKVRKEILEAIIQSQEKEREQISVDIHEGVTQILASVNMMLELALSHPEMMHDTVKDSNEKIKMAIDDLRLISQNINSSTLRLLGLVATAQDMLKMLFSHSSIQHRLDTTHYKESSSIDFSIQLATLRILQEVVRNVLKHSQATETVIEFHSSKSYLQLFVRDNGIGFDSVSEPLGLGFKNIFARAEQYGGNVEIVSEPGKGCLVQIILPVSAMDDSITNFSD